MPSLRGMVFVAGAIGLAFAVTNPVSPQPLNRLPPARAPCSVLSGRPCHPSFCGVFHAGPCFPQICRRSAKICASPSFRPTITLATTCPPELPVNPAIIPRPRRSRLMRSANYTPRCAPAGCRRPRARRATAWNTPSVLRSSATARSWRRPSLLMRAATFRAKVRDTYRDAVNAALTRCTPLHFSDGMTEAVVGRPIAIRFVDDRTTGAASPQ